MGNCPSFEIAPSIDWLEHEQARSGYRTIDKRVPVKTQYTVTFELDEPAAVNINRFLSGTLSTNVIYALQGASTEYALKFVSDNPDGPNWTWNFWKIVLTANGALQLIKSEWIAMSFTGTGLSDATNHATSPYITVTYDTTTTTSTTSSTTVTPA
jgi:hypothetical protein